MPTLSEFARQQYPPFAIQAGKKSAHDDEAKFRLHIALPAADPARWRWWWQEPIAVDLNGNGFEFVNVDDSNVFFDVNGDGWKHRTSWVGKDDGLLAYDIDGDGKIDKAGEISFTRYKEGAQSDLEGLRAFDSNGDDRFDAADDKWAKFGVWQDANQNGVTDTGEFRTLTELGVAAVNLTSDGNFQVINGQTVQRGFDDQG